MQKNVSTSWSVIIYMFSTHFKIKTGNYHSFLSWKLRLKRTRAIRLETFFAKCHIMKSFKTPHSFYVLFEGVTMVTFFQRLFILKRQRRILEVEQLQNRRFSQLFTGFFITLLFSWSLAHNDRKKWTLVMIFASKTQILIALSCIIH